MKKVQKIKMFILSFTFILIFSLPFVYAGVWTPVGFVKKVQAGYTNKDVYIWGLENKAGCFSDAIIFTTSSSDPEKIEKLATGAFLSGKKIRCVVDGCNGWFQNGKQCYLIK